MSYDPEERFSEALKRWARRPPGLSPEQAAAEWAQRLDQRPDQRPDLGRARGSRRPRFVWIPRLAAAAAVLAAGVAGWWILEDSRTMPTWDLAHVEPTPKASQELEPPPLEDGVAVFWLDPETPLYLTIDPPKSTKGSRS